MQKPNNFDQVEVGGDFTPVTLGGHHMVIKNVEEMTSKTGKAMLKVSFDFAKSDKQAGYFMESFKKDVRPDKKWPNQATQYITTVDNSGNTMKSFKSFIKAYEDSNNCMTSWADGPQFAAQFKNKLIGGVFGNIEEEYNGEVKMRRRLRWFCNDANASTAKVPADRLLDRPAFSPAPVQATASANDFVAVPEGTEEEIPF